MPTETPALTVDKMHKRFGQLEVLRGVSLTANDGDVISILGSSGSGKSTFLRCINLLETPDEGVVTVAGETIKMRRRRDGRSEPADRRQVDRIRSELAHGVSELQSLVAYDGAGKPDRSAGACAEAPARGMRRGSARAARQGRHRRQMERTIPRISRAASSSGRRSRARSPCGRR